MAALDNLSGTTIRGYELRRQIGIGGFGAVYNAYQSVVEREVAVKVVHPRFASQIEFIRRFEIEARLVARLEHMNIVPLYDFWRDPTGAYLVMRWLRGGNIRTLLDKTGALPVEMVVQLLNQIANALTVAHANGVIHRDIKPENILLDEKQNAYLSDFGIAIDIINDPDEVMLKNLSFGSPAYMSPEQIMGKGSTPQADVYSLGILIYEMLTARNPFPNETTQALIQKQVQFAIPSLKEVRPELSSEMDTIIWKATAKTADARYRDTLTLASAFEKAAVRISTHPRVFPSTPAGTVDRSGSTLPLNIDNVNIDTRRLIEDSTLDLQSATTNLSSEDEYPTTTRLDENVIRNPYKGLRAFEELDAGDFFGRRNEIDRLLKLFENRQRRFLAVIGPSGSGKSSLVRAGLLAELRGGTLPGAEAWLIVSMMPGDEPFEKLAEALLRVSVEAEPNLARHLQANSTRLNQFVNRLLGGKSELVLLIDQFEEVFTGTEDETIRAKFLESLHYAATQPDSRLRIIITLRADFYDRPLQYKAFGELLRENTEVVLPLSPSELEEAVVGPAQLAGLLLEPGLSKTIVEDVYQQPGALPLLQYALTELFEWRQGNRLTHESYHAIGGVRGALARRAEQTYQELRGDETLPLNQLSPDQQRARQLFLRLVTVGESGATRKRVQWGDLFAGLDDGARRVMDRFAQHRLLTFDNDPITRAPTVEVAHEALIAEWERFQSWIEENRSDLQKRQRLASMTGDWLNAKRDESFLVSGSRLAEFEPLLIEALIPLNRDEQTFIKDSIRLREQTVRRTRMVIAALTIFLLVALGFAVFAVDRQLQAEREARISRSGALAATGLTEQARNDLALLLGVAAVDTADTYQARDSLLTALQTNPALSAYLHGHESGVRSVAYNGIIIASGDQNGAVIRWDAAARQIIGEPLIGHSSAINDVSMAGDSIASAGGDGRVQIWNSTTGEASIAFDGHQAPVWSVALNAEGRLAASGDENGTILIWQVEDGEVVHRIEPAHAGIVYDLAFTPDGALLASGGADNLAQLWDVETGKAAGSPLEGHTNWVMGLAFAPSGRILATGGADRQVILWDIQNQRAAAKFDTGHGNYVRSVAFSPTGEILATASLDGIVKLWSVIEQQPFGQPLRVHRDSVWSVAFHPSELKLVSGGSDASVLIWDIQPPLRPAENAFVTGGEVLALDLNDTYIATAGSDGAIQVWNRTENTALFTLEGHTGAVTDLEYSGNILASSGVDSHVILWDMETQKPRFDPFTAHQAIVETIAFASSGRRLFSGDADGRIIEWDTSTGRQLDDAISTELPGILSLATSHNGQFIAVGGRDGSIRVWNRNTKGFIDDTPLKQHIEAVTALVFSADDRLLISAGRDGRILLWNTDTLELSQQPLIGHTDWILSLALSPDNRLLASAGRDNTVILWDFTNGRPLGRPFAGHFDQINALRFSPDNRWLYSGSRDTSVIQWSVALEDWQQIACSIVNRSFNRGEWAQYFSGETFEAERYCPRI
jgi:WD40 repeat protein/serine/threonine protein kinase/energy-coupling factor transporter ATP-binding protein EcfA2